MTTLLFCLSSRNSAYSFDWVQQAGLRFSMERFAQIQLSLLIYPSTVFSSFFMGCLASGPDLMNIVETRFTPDRRQEEQEEDQVELLEPRRSPRLERLRRRKRNRIYRYHRRKGDDELRQVQLLALERRIRASSCLLLFPVAKEEADLMQHYFADGYRRSHDERRNDEEHELMLQDENHISEETNDPLQNVELNRPHPSDETPPNDTVDYGTAYDRDLDQIIYDVSSSFAGHVQSEAKLLSSNLQRLTKVTLADGWDVGTTPEAMSEDLMLGLRDGFCGALSSFSSWNSSMVALIRGGNIQEALVGYLLGLQLPIVAYRFGQHVAVFVFVWRCRREVKRDERRGYGNFESRRTNTRWNSATKARRENLNVKRNPIQTFPRFWAVATAFIVLSLVAQVTSLSFYNDPEDQLIALSLLFSPFGVMARWRLSRYKRSSPGLSSWNLYMQLTSLCSPRESRIAAGW